jgi:hypothetical protein
MMPHVLRQSLRQGDSVVDQTDGVLGTPISNSQKVAPKDNSSDEDLNAVVCNKLSLRTGKLTDL